MAHRTVEKIRELQLVIEKLASNKDLSAAGVAKHTADFKQQLANYKGTAYSELKSDWGKIKSLYDVLSEKRRVEEARAAAEWESSRLILERDRVADFIQAAIANYSPIMGGPSPAELIAARYRDVASSGDRHAALAWAEKGPTALRAANLEGIGDLLSQMQADSVRLRDTPELARLRDEGDKLTRRAVELDQATIEAGQTWGEDGGMFSPSSFRQLSAGFSLTQKVDVETLSTTTTLVYDGPDAGQGEAAPVAA